MLSIDIRLNSKSDLIHIPKFHTLERASHFAGCFLNLSTEKTTDVTICKLEMWYLALMTKAVVVFTRESSYLQDIQFSSIGEVQITSAYLWFGFSVKIYNKLIFLSKQIQYNTSSFMIVDR